MGGERLLRCSLVKGNADFRGFTDLIAHFAESHNGKPGANEVARRVVYEWMEQVLIEAVLGARSLEGGQYVHSRKARSRLERRGSHDRGGSPLARLQLHQGTIGSQLGLPRQPLELGINVRS